MENIILSDSFKNSSKIMGLATAEVVMGQNMFDIWCCWKIDLQTVLSQSKEEHSEKVKTFFWWKDHKYILIYLSTYFSFHTICNGKTLYIITRLALSKLHTYLDRRSRQTDRLVLGPIFCKKVFKIQIILCYVYSNVKRRGKKIKADFCALHNYMDMIIVNWM